MIFQFVLTFSIYEKGAPESENKMGRVQWVCGPGRVTNYNLSKKGLFAQKYGH